MIQHEYLHQVDFEETVEYVDKIIREESKELIVYHGTTYDFKSIELTKSRNRRDFGRGFYTTILKTQAIEWGVPAFTERKSAVLLSISTKCLK